MRRRVVLHEIFTIIGCSKTHLILLNKGLFFLQNFLFFKPFSYQVSSWNTGYGLHPVRLQPAIGLYELIPYLIDAQSIVVKGQHEISTDLEVVHLLIRASLISIVVPIEAVLQSEGVHDFEFFPYDNPRSAQLACLNAKTTRA